MWCCQHVDQSDEYHNELGDGDDLAVDLVGDWPSLPVSTIAKQRLTRYGEAERQRLLRQLWSQIALMRRACYDPLTPGLIA